MSERARVRAAPRARATSDVARGRKLAVVAAAAALGAGATLAIGRPELGGARPLARPHLEAKLACVKCHDDAKEASIAPGAPRFAAAGACATCHGKAAHASSRPAHRALAARGELTCATCHPPHAGAQGVTVAPGGALLRWGAGSATTPAGAAPELPPGTTVPLVSLSACARCHDPSRASDPIAACVAPDARAAAAGPAGAAALREAASRCFDEHTAAVDATGGGASGRGRAACAAQHGDARFVAWEVAREAAARSSWVEPSRAPGSPWAPPAAALASASAVAAGLALLERKRRRSPAPAAVPAPATKRRLPVVDPTTCLGCYACVDACPFDVLAIERYVAVVARPDECCGVVLCAQVCPNGSLSIAEGEPVADAPSIDEHLESRDVPGVFVAGDLTGLPLIKNAINQGVSAVDRLAATLPRRRPAPVDVVVVGAGPAGLAAALRAREKGLSCVVLEQATVAASIKSFPRDKIVHDPPLELPVEGELWLKEATKEELVAQWTRIVRARALDVREGRRVTSIAKDEAGAFVVTAARGDGEEVVRAARVVVAIGKRGTPRTLDLDVESGAEERVSYALADARSFEGKRVVVAGLGDSAMEAAVALARQPGTMVTISYRGRGFARGKARNVAEVKALADKGRLRILFETVPVAVSRAGVTLASTAPGGARRSIGADALLVLVGGVPSWDLLERAGVRRPAPVGRGPEDTGPRGA